MQHLLKRLPAVGVVAFTGLVVASADEPPHFNYVKLMDFFDTRMAQSSLLHVEFAQLYREMANEGMVTNEVAYSAKFWSQYLPQDSQLSEPHVEADTGNKVHPVLVVLHVNHR